MKISNKKKGSGGEVKELKRKFIGHKDLTYFSKFNSNVLVIKEK